MKWSGGTPCRAEWSFLTRFWYGEDWPPLFDYWDDMGARLRGAGSKDLSRTKGREDSGAALGMEF